MAFGWVWAKASAGTDIDNLVPASTNWSGTPWNSTSAGSSAFATTVRKPSERVYTSDSSAAPRRASAKSGAAARTPKPLPSSSESPPTTLPGATASRTSICGAGSATGVGTGTAGVSTGVTTTGGGGSCGTTGALTLTTPAVSPLRLLPAASVTVAITS